MTSVTGTSLDEHVQRHEPVSGTFNVYLKQRQGGTRPSPAGLVRAHLYTLRWAAPIAFQHTVDEGWRFQDEDGREYEVLDCVRTGRSYRITAQRVG